MILSGKARIIFSADHVTGKLNFSILAPLRAAMNITTRFFELAENIRDAALRG